MVGALWTGISGLAGQQTALNNESNNIANVNTIGYKSGRISFADQMYQDKIGSGTTVLDVEKLYKQGSLKLTGVSYDMALSGDGFFEVKPAGTSDLFYTRAGNFRMGTDGTLQDSSGNAVQGWTMTALETSDITSTNTNISTFTEDYIKLAASYVIKKETSVETITAKMTDYTETTQADDKTLMTGAGYKTKSSKIADIEALISDYTEKLSAYSLDPAATSTPSIASKGYVDFDLDDTTDMGSGDQIYVYVNGTKYSQSFDTDEKTTLQALTNQLSQYIPGINAYIADYNATPGSIPDIPSSSILSSNPTNVIKIESLIPGTSFTIGDVGFVDGTATTLKTGAIITEAVAGSGLGAVNSAMEALRDVAAGNQRDVWATSNLSTIADDNADADADVTTNPDKLDYSLTVGGTTYTVSVSEGSNAITTDASDTTVATTTAVLSDANKLTNLAEAINSHSEMADNVVAMVVNGNLIVESTVSGQEYTSSLKFDDQSGGTLAPNNKNSDYSINSGGAAEFLQIRTTIDQTSSRNSLQLRLDTLAISDSAFGDFNVDASGLITMKQDGATFAVGQVAVALFNNNRGLMPEGGNLLSTTVDSGKSIFNVNNRKTAEVMGSTVELSTADLSESLVNLMVFQRAFEANAKSITTADKVLETLIQLKR